MVESSDYRLSPLADVLFTLMIFCVLFLQTVSGTIFAWKRSSQKETTPLNAHMWNQIEKPQYSGQVSVFWFCWWWFKVHTQTVRNRKIKKMHKVCRLQTKAQSVRSWWNWCLFRRQEAPKHKLVVLDDRVGHYPQWEDAESVLQHMVQFIQQTASKPSS